MKGKIRVNKYDTPEEALAFISEHQSGYGYYMLGLYDYNNRKFLPDGLAYEAERNMLRTDYVEENYPLESVRIEQARKSREAVKQVIGSYAKKFGIIALTICLCAAANAWLGFRLNPALGTCLAALFYSGGTLGYLVDWHIKTFGGKTKAEWISETGLIVSYVIGTAATVLSLTF